jgi:hypothetical protein
MLPIGMLPVELGRAILQKWLDPCSIAKADSAHCSRESRDQFLENLKLVCLGTFPPRLLDTEHFNRPVCRYEKRLEDMLRWKERRGVVVDILFIPKTLQDKQKDKKSVSQWLQKAGGPHVKHLVFENGWKQLKAKPLFKNIADTCPNLWNVDISGFFTNDMCAADKNLVKQGLVALIELCDLRSIIARGVCIDDTVFDTINGHGTNLIHLDLNRCVGISDAALSKIATACPKLQYLDVYGTAVSDEGMQDVAENCLDLRHVDLTDTNTGDDACVALGECCPELTYLACCAESTGILAIAEGCPKLQTLLNNCTSIGDHALVAVAKNCPQLRVLHVAGTRSICDESLQYLGMYSKVSV